MNNLNVSEYAIDVWETQLDAKLVKQLASKDWSEPYEVDTVHVFKLDNDKYVVVRESGCSCYDYSDARLTVFDTADEALKLYNEYVK